MKMMTMIGKFQRKWRKMGNKVVPSSPVCERCSKCILWPSTHRDCSIPKDVPKGHLVVYIGEEYKRFVIKITLLKHPLVKALLDLARDEFDFSNKDSKLCIPCDESLFLDVVQCAASPRHLKCFSTCHEKPLVITSTSCV